jgi:hypothetical protein
MNIGSSITFDSAEREYDEAWNAPSSTRFELPPVHVNKVLKERYRVSPDQTLTRAMIWDMETKKAWDPLTYIPYVVYTQRAKDCGVGFSPRTEAGYPLRLYARIWFHTLDNFYQIVSHDWDHPIWSRMPSDKR